MGIFSAINSALGKGELIAQEDQKLLADMIKEFKTRDQKMMRKLLKEEVAEEIKEEENFNKAINFFTDKIDLANKFIEIMPLYYDNSGLWWAWNSIKRCWRIKDEIDILNLISKSSRANTISPKEKTEILNALKQVARLNKPTDIQKTWIQFNDEIVDIETGKRFQATPSYFVTNPIPWNLGETSTTQTMNKLFEEWVGKEHTQTLYQILAYCLLPDYPIHRLFCFIGAGMNGKSCFLRLLSNFLGRDNVTSTDLDKLIGSRFELTKLHKKLACIMGETNFAEISKTSTLKQLTGQDMVGFEYKNKNPFDDANYAKILISTNNLPTTTDKTIGFYRRWCIIDFPNQFEEKIDILGTIPLEEYENLGTKSVGILMNLLKERKFYNEGNIEERMKRYEDHSDPLEKFLKEYALEDADGYIWKFEFEKRLNEWCKENRFRQISQVGIGKKMKEKGIPQELKVADWLQDGSNKRIRAWVGLKWRKFEDI